MAAVPAKIVSAPSATSQRSERAIVRSPATAPSPLSIPADATLGSLRARHTSSTAATRISIDSAEWPITQP